MGSQQLLLIVLGVIVVGITVALAINAFGANAEQSKKDAISEDCLHMAAAAQGYFRKPAVFGGGNNSFNKLTITDCGMPEFGDNLTGQNLNATYLIEAADNVLSITGLSRTDESNSVVLVCDMDQIGKDRVVIEYENW